VFPARTIGRERYGCLYDRRADSRPPRRGRSPELTARYLKGSGCIVTIVGAAPLALEATRKHTFDAVLLDGTPVTLVLPLRA
jgi:hypothetical protein